MSKKDLKPNIFVGSSGSTLGIANAVAKHLSKVGNCRVWTSGVFVPSNSTLDDLLAASTSFEFGVFIFAPDDKLIKKGDEILSTRDNVLFECGMFYGSCGKSRTLFLIPKDVPGFKVPSDLYGITAIQYTVGGLSLAADADPAAMENNLKCAFETIDKVFDNVVTDHSQSFRRLEGKWIQEWEVTSENFDGTNSTEAELIVFGDSVIAQYRAKSEVYRLRGRVKDSRIITGTWANTNLQSGYHGTFQLQIAPDGLSMKGCWLGWSSTGGVKCGNWRWVKQTTGKKKP